MRARTWQVTGEGVFCACPRAGITSTAEFVVEAESLAHRLGKRLKSYKRFPRNGAFIASFH